MFAIGTKDTARSNLAATDFVAFVAKRPAFRAEAGELLYTSLGARSQHATVQYSQGPKGRRDFLTYTCRLPGAA